MSWISEFVSVTAAVSVVSCFIAVLSAVGARRLLKLQREELERTLTPERSLRTLLECTSHATRTFDGLRMHLKGYDDDELRKLLIRAGAIQFPRDKETWGLVERNMVALEKEHFTKHL